MQVSSHQTYARALMGEYEEAPLGGRLLDDSDLADVANRVAEMSSLLLPKDYMNLDL